MELRALPVHAVGEATAEAALDEGFAIARTGEGGLHAIVGQLTDAPGRYLRLCGEARVQLQCPEGVEVDDRVVYRAEACELDRATAARLDRRGIVALHSGEAARHFAEECNRLGIARERLMLVLIGPRLVEAAGSGWGAVHIADAPRDGALLAKVRDVCKDTCGVPRKG